MRSMLCLSLFFICTLALAQTPDQPGVYGPQKVVYHINYGDHSRFQHTLTNMANHIEEVGEDQVEIKAVVHGEAIELFMEAAADDEELAISIDSARFNGVQFIICGNSLSGYQITYEDLYDVEASDVVKAGLPEIVRLQQNGYIYVRP